MVALILFLILGYPSSTALAEGHDQSPKLFAGKIGANGYVDLDLLTDEELFYLTLALGAKHGPMTDIESELQRFVTRRALQGSFQWLGANEFENERGQRELVRRMTNVFADTYALVESLDIFFSRKERWRLGKYSFQKNSVQLHNRNLESNIHRTFDCSYDRGLPKISATEGIKVSPQRRIYTTTHVYEHHAFCQNPHLSGGRFVDKSARLTAPPEAIEELIKQNPKRDVEVTYLLRPRAFRKVRTGRNWDFASIPTRAYKIELKNAVTGYKVQISAPR